ncbi:COG3650 family protein [Pseudomonas taiwanensis]|uniref:COG3650 family protein n=1 Tax=Pseudomonas taiwanensis TaxID=470150 RepID=UPI0003FD8A69|nr:membrane protein [Pseudomonas taiwanensis]
MRIPPTLLLASLLPLFAGCQLMAHQPSDPNIGTTRMQGELSAGGGQLFFKPCGESRRFVISDVGGTGILQEAANLADDANDKLFADVRGRLTGSKQANNDGQLEVRRLYRLEGSTRACEDPNFKQLTLRASGHEPGWDIKASGKGMVLNRVGQDPLPLPFLEEEVPGGGLTLTSEANGKHVELWVAPQRCVDTATGAVQHLRAELHIDGQTLKGCGYYGGARDN